ncbi:MAG TPA: hypothetical protein IAA26_14195 [Candidatus Blautia faecipullorum]|nr:hypothetical protein [Candidatus Blautia faecipullorum]
MKNIKDEKAPASGMMYALYKNRVIYQPYCVTRADWDGDMNRFILEEMPDSADNLLELHLFDDRREYRMVIRRGLEPVSKLIDDNCLEKGGFAYIEKHIHTLDLAHSGKTGVVNIVNYVSYDEDDLLYIENYRLMEVKKL